MSINIKCLNPGGYSANCYILTDEATGQTAILDPGGFDAELEDILKNADVKYICLTHRHYDHVLGAAAAKKLTGAKVAIHSQDACGIHNSADCLASHAPYAEFTPLNEDVALEDGDLLKLGDTTISVMHTPGHTAGGVCYIADDVIFSGDTIFKDSIGRLDLPSGSADDMAQSLKRINHLEGGFTILPGHGPATTLQHERQSNPHMASLRNK